MTASGGDEDDAGTGGWSRRAVLGLASGGLLGAGAARVVYELLGFGAVTGTNLTQQRLGRIAGRRLEPSPFDLAVGDRRLAFDGEAVTVGDDTGGPDTTVQVVGTPVAAVASRAPDGALAGALGRLAADLDALSTGAYTFECSGPEAFFDRLGDTRGRPLTVATLRGGGYRRPGPTTVRAFAGVDPADPASLVDGLAAGFRDHAHFDATRYAAGAVEDHLLFDAVSLKARFRERPGLGALLEGSTGLYCWEFTLRSVEAFHAVAPHRQSVPVFGGIVYDRRHNHVYTCLASVVREGGDLTIPMTFLDYSRSTLHDTTHLGGVLGDGVDAYGGRHRATTIDYRNRYGRRPPLESGSSLDAL